MDALGLSIGSARRLSVLILTPVFVVMSAGASVRTANFVVHAETAEVAREVANQAEKDRAKIAKEWLGRELPRWPQPCPIKVKLTAGEAGGLTSFGFAGGGVTDQSMSVEGRLDRILASAIPHEVTHTVFAAYFGAPMPRWADEGASLLSEDDREKHRHDQIAVNLLARRGDWPLVKLFVFEDYPSDLMGFYGQGYSISRFLVEIGGRPRFLGFVREGMESGWDKATLKHYGLADVRELDRAWRAWHTVSNESQPGTPGNVEVVRAQSDAVNDDLHVSRRFAASRRSEKRVDERGSRRR
ncbi:hypothetical protein EP7_003920 [Isosphaeraceae bacterium EP7]